MGAEALASAIERPRVQFMTADHNPAVWFNDMSAKGHMPSEWDHLGRWQ